MIRSRDHVTPPPIPQVDHTLYIYSYILFVEIHFIICKFKTAKLSSAPDQMLVSVLCCVVDPGELRVMFFLAVWIMIERQPA